MTEHEKKLAGGVAVITGAGAGIGAGIALAKEIQEAGGNAEAMTVDVSKPENLDELADIVFKKYKSVRLLVNNAGVETIGYTWEIPTARWEATLNINVHGVIHGVRAFVPRMLETREECWIANLSSIGAFGQMPMQTAYIMSKHAVQSFSECLYLEMQETKAPIHVSSVVPGMLKTEIFGVREGADETDAGLRHRKAMREMMQNHGMDLTEGCERIVKGIAAGQFWCDTQPDMTAATLGGRIAFLQGQKDPELAESARHLLAH
ncbi:putative oxido [Cyphellophora attinorum]|uniref:Putative oxido n=1 Tax=Cyphellophora attinorum TaxID=1664694 RepID=A0A0N1HUJ0_9EURO|nr:putative oxido [Phialophora attinorum]KPI43072.1 putative oxido [Phialophora attinorum]